MSEIETPEINILDQCLSSIQSGKATVETCLAQFPEHAEALEPLLRMALQARSRLAPAPPKYAFVKNAKIRILNQLQIPEIKSGNRQGRDRKFAFLGLRPAYAFLSLVLVLGLLLSGISATTASASALPGDALYGLKRGIEETQLLFTFSAPGDAELLLQFTEERLEEAASLAEANRDAHIPAALEGYENLLERLIDLADTDEIAADTEILDKIQSGLDRHQEILQRVYEKAPPQARKGLENAMEQSTRGKSVIEKLKESGKPSDQAPGQEKKDENQSGPPEERGGGRPDDKTPKAKPKDKTPGPPDQSGGNPNK